MVCCLVPRCALHVLERLAAIPPQSATRCVLPILSGKERRRVGSCSMCKRIARKRRRSCFTYIGRSSIFVNEIPPRGSALLRTGFVIVFISSGKSNPRRTESPGRHVLVRSGLDLQPVILYCVSLFRVVIYGRQQEWGANTVNCRESEREQDAASLCGV